METVFIENVPAKYEQKKEMIQNKTISKIYSQLDFLYLQIGKDENDNIEKNYVKKYLIDYIKQFRFATYQISKDNSKEILFQKVDIIICVEGKCLIIEQIEYDLFLDIITELTTQHISIIDINSNNNEMKEEITDEINSFCDYFRYEIRKNEFVKLTIRPISCYLIRRFFYPTNFFKDHSFFNFEQQFKIQEYDIRTKIHELLFINNDGNELYQNKMRDDFESIKNDIIDNNNNLLKNKKEFLEQDFIILRTLHATQKAIYYLVIHIKSFYIFMMKKFIYEESLIANNNDFIKMKREIDFCRNYSHRCLMRFYGFIKSKKRNIIGCIYEYLCNGPINLYINSNQNQISDIFSMTSILRIYQSIEYLHSNLFLYRDLKPFNILLDHDYIPFLSDFDTIRHPIDTVNDEEITNDLGSSFYMSPEQYNGQTISYPTDIFSFGLVAYYFIEKKNMSNQQYIVESIETPLINNASKYIQKLIEFCVNFDQSKRPNIKQIKNLLLKEFILPYYIEPYAFYHEIELKESEINCFFYENFALRIDDQKQLKILFDTLFSFKSEYFLGFVEKDKRVFMINTCFFDDDDDGSITSNEQNLFNEFDYNLNELEYNEFLAKRNNSQALLKLGDFYYNGKIVNQDYNKALKYYQLAAKYNHYKAFYKLGQIYFEGKGVKHDYLKAKKFFEIAASRNDSNSCFLLGIIYFYGYGVEINYTLAKKYFDDSSTNSKSLYYLGIIYIRGLNVEKDLTKAIKYFELSAKKKNPDAFYSLGIMYFKGIGFEKDLETSIAFFEFAAKKKHSDAMNQLGIIYLFGIGTDKDFSKALNYFTLAAKEQSASATYNLGLIYYNGYGVAKDILKAKYYFELASQLKISDSFIRLGDIFFNESSNIKQDYTKAIHYYELSAKFYNQFAFLKLGDIYFNGYGVPQSYSKAKHYYELSSYLNNPESYYNLGNMYLNGYGIDKDILKAKYYFEKSCQLNFPKALFYLGNFYSIGESSYFDINKSIYYFEKCIKFHYNTIESCNIIDQTELYIFMYNELYYQANNNLGLIYITLFQDQKNAEKYLKEAGLNEYPYGQNNYGLLYQFYLKNNENAKYMFEKALNNNFFLAAYNLGYLREQNGETEEAMKLYRKASDNRDNPIIFQNIKQEDAQLNISKMFIICLNDMKLTEYYFSKNNFNESRDFFIKSYSNLKIENKNGSESSYNFRFKIKQGQKNDFEYLETFIFCFPLFDLDLNMKNQSKKEDEKYDNDNSLKINKFLEKNQKINDNYSFDEKIFNDPGELFDFVIRNKNLIDNFIDRIRAIISSMEKILYRKPYDILFGRMNMVKLYNLEKEKKSLLKNIDKLFYEGFGQDICADPK